MPSKHKKHLLLAVVLLLFFTVLIGFVFSTKPQSAKAQFVPQVNNKVELETVALGSHSMNIHGEALLMPKQSVKLFAQLNGIVLTDSKLLQTGKSFKQGDILLAIDSTHAELELQQALTQLKQAELKLMELEAQQKSQNSSQTNLSALAQGKPQHELAQQQIAAAKAALTLAERKLAASKIIAPFDGRVLQANVQAGDMLSIGMPLGIIYSHQKYQARIPISQRWINFIDFAEQTGKGSKVTASDPISGEILQGIVQRHEGKIAENQMIYLIADFDSLTIAQPSRLFAHSRINVYIHSKSFDNIAVIPSHALRGNDQVWLLDKQQKLAFKKVHVLYRDKDKVYINQGLENGDQLITSAITSPIEGMSLVGENP